MIVIKNKAVRKVIKYTVPYVLIPAAVAVVFDEKRYAYVSLAVTVLAILLFVSGFEKKKTGNRRIVIASVMTALSVAGRFIPFFKPVTALTIFSAMYLGGESGFLVGAMSALISNFYFGQGPWTPFQMFAFGMIGLVAGLLSDRLLKSRAALYVYGAASGIVYSFIMDVWTVLWYNGQFSFSLYIAALATAIPYTVIYSVSNVFFLKLFSKPFGDKLGRIKIKYGV